MTFKKHLAVIFAIAFICLSGCSNSTQTIIATQPESSVQDMSISDPSVEATEIDIIQIQMQTVKIGTSGNVV